MKKLNLAIIGQGRSGKDIHGSYYLSEANCYYTVRYVVEADARRREIAKASYPEATVVADYRELLDRSDIDLVVNASYSEMHYILTREFLANGKNVLVEKPLARTRYECDDLIRLADEKGVVLAVFQQSFYAPFYRFVYETAHSGLLGEIKQISIRYNGFSRRWDWQTLQKKCAGGVYNTGPHPIGVGLGLIDFDPNASLIYSSLATALTSGDADDYAKLLIKAPNKALVDIEISSIDAYSDYNVKLQGTRGTLKASTTDYEMTYLIEGENPDRPVQEKFLEDYNGNPLYCSEELIKHTERGSFTGTAFDVGTAQLYRELYFKITEGVPMQVSAGMAAEIISIAEAAHAQNPLPLKY